MNADVTVDDVNRAEAIYGRAVPLIKGKMVRKRPQHLSEVPRVELPPPLLKHHPHDDLDIDFLYIQGAPYLLTKTHRIKFNPSNALTESVPQPSLNQNHNSVSPTRGDQQKKSLQALRR